MRKTIGTAVGGLLWLAFMALGSASSLSRTLDAEQSGQFVAENNPDSFDVDCNESFATFAYAPYRETTDFSWNLISGDDVEFAGESFAVAYPSAALGTPEPAVFALVGTGLVALSAVRRSVRGS
jgi:hypothetical protein